jgi:hypothetical protein
MAKAQLGCAFAYSAPKVPSRFEPAILTDGAKERNSRLGEGSEDREVLSTAGQEAGATISRRL